MQSVLIRLPDDLAHEARIVAAVEGLSRNRWVAQLVTRGVAEAKSRKRRSKRNRAGYQQKRKEEVS